MHKIKLGLIVGLSLCLILVAVQNTASVQASFLWFTGEAPIILLLVMAAGGGFILGVLVALANLHKQNRKTTPRE
ncbi:MAG: LapA family protein [Spirochaetales bacterium]|nr:LapA family protein [Spirochaetales bacterium]